MTLSMSKRTANPIMKTRGLIAAINALLKACNAITTRVRQSIFEHLDLRAAEGMIPPTMFQEDEIR